MRHHALLRTLFVSLFALPLVFAAGCDDDDNGDSAGDSTSGDNDTGNDTSNDTGNDTSNDTGNDTSNDTGNDTGSDCDQTDPNGTSCTVAENCEIACDCGDGLTATIGSCVVGSCGSSPSDCGSACSDAGGTYGDNYCFVGTPGDGDSGDGDEGSPNCTPAGGGCTFSSDCCSESCDFDDICE